MGQQQVLGDQIKLQMGAASLSLENQLARHMSFVYGENDGAAEKPAEVVEECLPKP